MGDDSSRDRKVRGRKIRTERETKQQKRADKELKQLRREHGEEAGDLSLDEFPGGPFVETDEVAALESRVGRWLDADQPVHLIGPTGCGKTALGLHAAIQRDAPVVWINGDADLTTSDLVGEHAGEERYEERDQYIRDVVKRKSIVRDHWVDNPLTVAVREGATLVYNEFSRTKPAANNVLLSVFEEGVLELPGQRGEKRQVEVHPDFRAILTSNSTEYAGVHEPQDALLDRTVGIHMGFYGFETEVEIVSAHVDDLPRERIEDIVAVMQTLRDELDIEVGTRAALMAARGFAAFPDEDDALAGICTDVLASKVASRSEAEELRSTIMSILEGDGE